MKLLLQQVQENGLSPVWVRRCVFRLLLREKALLQCTHLYGFTPGGGLVVRVTPGGGLVVRVTRLKRMSLGERFGGF